MRDIRQNSGKDLANEKKTTSPAQVPHNITVHPSEWPLLAYFVYTTLLAYALDLPPSIPAITVLLNLLVLGGYVFLIWADSFRRGRLLTTIRNWFPLLLLLLAYRQMGWFAPEYHDFHLERSWIVWDRWLLRDLGLKGAIETFGPLLPSVLEISYSLVYALAPFSMAMLYAYRRSKYADRFLLVMLPGVLLAYAQFPFWPSEPPRVVFPGEDFPSYNTIFREFNWRLLGGYGIHTSVFPSAHVSGAFAAAFGMMRSLPDKPWVWRLLLGMAVLIATATVYGRYHYAVDAVAGFFVAAVVAAAVAAHDRRRASQKTF
jgi:membrane-associated phospholipid phosphatase